MLYRRLYLFGGGGRSRQAICVKNGPGAKQSATSISSTEGQKIRRPTWQGTGRRIMQFQKSLFVLKWAVYLARWALLYVLDAITWVFAKRGSGGGVAIVRTDNIGDFVLWLDSVAALLKQFEGHSKTLIANSTWCELAEKLPFWDNIIPIETGRFIKSPVYRASVLRRVSRMGFEIAIQPAYSRYYLIGDTIIRFTQARERIGSFGNLTNILPWQKRISDRWYTRLLKADPKPITELQRNEEFVRAIGNTDFRATLPFLPKVSELSNTLRIERPYFIICPGASWYGRQWPTENFAKLIDKIGFYTDWTAVLCGSHADYHLCVEVAASATRDSINLAGKASLNEFIEIIRDAKVLVGNESAAVHIASAVGTPSICILGGGHFGRFLPYKYKTERFGVPPVSVFHSMDCFGCNWTCTQRHVTGQAVPCVSRIEVSHVLQVVKRYLKQ